MKLIIAGGRSYQLTEKDYERLDGIHERHKVTEVLSGAANGADTCGEIWAKSKGIPVHQFHADWATHGKIAGPLRNRQMAQFADAVALFPGGKGTDSMFREAKDAGINIFDWRQDNGL